MNNTAIKVHGLKIKGPNKKTFKLGAIFNFPMANTLPESFLLPDTKIKNQGAKNSKNDKCSAYSSTSASELQEEVDLNPDYTFAAGKDLANEDVMSFGLSLDDVMLAHVKVGAIEQKDVPIDIDVENDKYRYIKNWPQDLMKKAYLHKKKSYFQVHRINGQDYFDSIKSAIWRFKDEKRAVVFGCMWDWPVWTKYIEEPVTTGFGHAMEIKGWLKTADGKEWLKVQQSAGENAGDHGYHYFSRKAINAGVEIFGAFMHVDMPKDTAEWYLNNDIKENDNWITITFKILLIKKLIDSLKELIGLTPKMKTTEPMINTFCKAIQEHEGWFEGSRSWRNNNPGNLRYVGQSTATGHDEKNFCIFPSYEVGFQALLNMIKRAASGNSVVYKPNMSFKDFFNLYAPSSDNNNPDAYAKFVANKCGVSITTQIKVLVV